MAVQINVAANQAALTASIQAGVQAYNQKFAQNNPINLSVNQRAFSQPLGRMTGDVKDFEAALAASNARVIAFGASTAVLGGVIRSFKELANVTIDVEKNLADINRVFGLTTSQLQKFSTDLFSVGKQTASSFDDASKAALEFSRQGLKAEEVLIRTKDALTLARVAGISTANSVDALTSTINGFAATGVTTTQILNKLVAVEQDFAVGAGDLAEALSRTGQAAQEAGVSLDQLNALVTAAQQSTARGGAVIGNALKTIFTRLQRTDTLDQLEAFNIAVRDVQGNTLPAVTVLQNFAGAYKNLGDAQRAQLSEQVAGVYQVNILKAIVGDLNKSQGVYAGALQRGASATNEAEVATAKLNQTLDALLKQTATSTQQLANNIGKVTFEPLARYGTEQLKSLVESMNEILEGEGVGSTFANGLLKGIRNVIAGPGAIAAFFTLFKLIQNSFTYLAQALPQIAGITTETQNRKNIESAILQIMAQQGTVAQALDGLTGNQAAQAQLLLQTARAQTAEYQKQAALAQQLSVQLSGQGVKVAGNRGLQVTRAGGYIPNATRMAEAVGAQAGGYAPGKVVKSPVGGVMNTAEDVKYVPGFAQPFINPPAGSKAGRAHRQNAISRTGVDPYTAGGFIPNFAKKSIKSLGQQSLNNLYDVGDRVGNTTFYDKYDDQELIKTFNLPYTYEEYRLKAAYAYDNASKIYQKEEYKNIGLAKANEYLKKVTGGYSQALEKKYFDQADTSPAERHLNKIAGGFGEKDTAEIFSKHTKLINAVGPDFKKIIKNRVSFIETKVRKNDVPDEVLLEKFLRGYAKTSLPVLFKRNGGEDVISAKFGTLIHAIAAKTPDTKSLGFIPNFAPPTSAIRVPWFKKFGNASFDAVQPTLGISKANDTDTFRSSQFRSKAFEKAATDGDPNLFAPLYEDFVFKALQLTSQSKIKDQLIRGYVNQPGTNQNQSAYDAFLGDVALEDKGFPKRNLIGSISKNLNDKFERYAKANPAGAAKIKEAIMIFNEVGHENQIPSEFGKNFTQLAGTSYSQMLKNSPDLVKGLSAETNSLLNNYVKNPAFLAMNAAKGFVPNFNYNDIGLDALTSKLGREGAISQDLTQFVIDLKNQRYAMGDGFHREIIAKNFGEIVTDEELSNPKNANTYLKGSYDKNSGKTIFYKSFAQSMLPGKLFESKHPYIQTVQNELKSRFAKRQASAPVKRTKLPASEEFRRQYPGPSPDNHFNNGLIPNFAESVTPTKEQLAGLGMTIGEYKKLSPRDKNDVHRTISNFGKGYAQRTEGLKTKPEREALDKIRGQAGKRFIYTYVLDNAGQIYYDKNQRLHHIEVASQNRVEKYVRGYFATPPPEVLDFANGSNSPSDKEFKEITSNKEALKQKLIGKFSKPLTYGASTLTRSILNAQNPGPDPESFGNGFIPNFAYKQAVMGLEESMSGNKAVFDSKPFPHIRNKSQPTFSSAIADHGGLGNALSDSMRGQKDAGLMSKGYVPNFAAPQNNRDFDVVRFSSLISKSVDDFGKKLSFKIGTVKENILFGLDLMNGSFDPQKIERTAESAAKKIILSVSNVGDQFAQTISSSGLVAISDIRNKFTSQKASQSTGNGSSQRPTAAQMAASFGNFPTSNPGLEKFTQSLSKASTAIAIAGPMLAGFIEQAVYGNKKRTDMTSGERGRQSFLSTGLSSISTGAGIGASFGLPGVVVGGLAGSLVALTSAFKATTLTVEELHTVAGEYKTETQQSVSAAQSYIETLKTFQTSTDPEIIKKASTSLEQYFKNIEDVELQKTFKQTGDDVDKLATSLKDYEKRRTVEQGRKEEAAKAAGYTGASFKDLTKAGYSASTFGKTPYLQKYEKPEELAQQAITDFSRFFDDLQKTALDESGIKDLQKLVSDQRNRSNFFGVTAFDQDEIRSFLQKRNVSADVSVSLSEMFDNLENQGNLVGSYIIDNLVNLFSKSKNEIKKQRDNETTKETTANNFLSFRRTLLEKISDEFIGADTAVKSFESQSSLSQLLPAKLKEINDLIFNSILNNVSTAKGFSLKKGQTIATATLQSQELSRQQSRATTEKQLKDSQAGAQFNKQISEIIFNSSINQGKQGLIDQFIADGPNRSKEELKTFAQSAIGNDVNAVDKLVNSLQDAQEAYKNTIRETEAQNKFKLQEISYNDAINKLTAATSLKQIALEKEKLSITLSQKDATNSLRGAVEKAKIAANESLELNRIEIGGEFRYLGLNKRQEFESKQIDSKTIFDKEQMIAENQVIADARRSIIEIAAQDANTKAQNENTNAIFDLNDSLASAFSFQGFKELNGGNVQIGLGKIAASTDIKARNEISRKQFNASKESIKLSELSNFGVGDNATIGDTIAKLKTKMQDASLTEEAKMSIKETITTLEISANQIGSSATIFQAKSAQVRRDFEQSAGFVNNMAIGFKNLGKEADDMVDQLGRNLPGMFADGLVDGIKAAIRESDNLGTALMGIASKFLDEISTTLMKAGVRNILSGVGFGDLIGGMTGNQKGGYIRAQSGMYISGTGTGDKYPAMLENGEYVLNRNAVMAMGGPSALDSLNFSAAPRFASGGSFGFDLASSKSDQDNLANMEKYMTSEGLDDSQLYNELSDVAKQKAAEDRAKRLEAKKQKAAMIGSLVAAVATIAIGAGLSNMASNAKATKAEALAAKAQGPENLTKSEIKAYEGFQKSGMINSYGEYAGPQAQTGFRSLTSKPFYSSNIYGPNPYAPAFKKNGRQTGGLIGSRLSDTIPGYMEGGLYNSPMVKRYGTGMQSGGSSISGAGNSNSTVNNNTNANNSFNFNTSVQRDGSIKMGANTTSYQQQDVELSKNLNTRMYAVVTEVIRKEKQFGGSLAGIRN